MPIDAASSARTTSVIRPALGTTGIASALREASRRTGPAAWQAMTSAAVVSDSADVTVSSRCEAPKLAFSSAGVPSAVTRPPLMTQIRSASRSASSRY